MALLLVRQATATAASLAAIAASQATNAASAESAAGNAANTALNTAQTASNTANNVVNTVNDVKHTFSSWDNCMSQAYCKWPVIVGIIIGSLIIFSVLYCIGRCLCCGAECVCCCFRCCAGGCGGGRKSNHEKQGYPAPGQPFPYNAQYQQPPMPMYGAASAFNAPRGAQTATFESPSKPVHEDSLPAMPSWENAQSKKVEVVEEQEAHEMNDLGSRGNDIASAQPMLPHSALSPATTPGQFGPPHTTGSQVGYGFPAHSSEALSPHGSQVGYRGATASPVAANYNGAPRNQYNTGYDRVGNDNRGPYNPYHSPRNPSSPVYTPSGSTAYDPPYNNNNNRSNSPYASPAPRSNNPGWGPQQQQQSYGQSQNQSQGYGGYSSQSPYGASRQDPYGSSQQGNGGYEMQGGGRKAVPNSWRDI